MLTSTLCSIVRTGETSTASLSQSSGISLHTPELSLPSGSNPVHQNNIPDSCSNKDNNAAEKRNPSQTEPLLKEHNSQCKQPQRTGTQGKITKNVASKGETLPQANPIPQTAELNHNSVLPWSSSCSPPFNGPDPDLHEDKTLLHDTKFLKCSTTFPETRSAIRFSQSFHESESCLHQDINSSQTRNEKPPVSKPQRNSLTNTSTSTSTQHTLHFQSSSSPQKSPLSQSEALPQINPVPQARGFAQSPNLTVSVLHKDRTHDLKSYVTCPQTNPTIPQDNNLPQSYLNSRNGLSQEVSSTQTSKETSSASTPQISSLTTAITVTQKNIYSQSSPPDCQSVPHASSNLRSQQRSPLSQSHGDLLEVHAPIPPEPKSLSDISISSSTITSSNRSNSQQSHQTVYSLHESLTSTCTQQCVHDPGMTTSSPAKSTAPPQPESQTHALAQQANLHVTSLSSPPHLLTPDQDPNICQPMTIREEIRLTPQIQGPPLPAPPHPQAESVPQGKASKPGPPRFTRPLSRATVMEGSPVTLEVEVTGQPEPALTWWVAYNQLHNNTQAL